MLGKGGDYKSTFCLILLDCFKQKRNMGKKIKLKKLEVLDFIHLIPFLLFWL